MENNLCKICPHNCNVDRENGKLGICKSGKEIKILLTAKYSKQLENLNERSQDLEVDLELLLVDREGNVVGRYSPTYKPEDMEDKIKELL